MKLVITAILTCLCLNLLGIAYQARQSTHTTSDAPLFDILSVKACPNDYRGSGRESPVRLRLDCITVETLISQAFRNVGLLPHEAEAVVKGGPSWIRSRRFNIEVVPEKPVTNRDMRAVLLMDVLKRRFQLTVREETRISSVYDLVQAPGGAKLQTSKGGCTQLSEGKPPQVAGGHGNSPICGGFGRSSSILWGGVDAYGVSMPLLCRRLSLGLDRDVIDKTGLTGTFDFHIGVSYDQLPIVMPRQPIIPEHEDLTTEPSGSVFSAVRKLGLRLVRSTNPSKVIVVVHVEVPAEN